jgi:DNA-binding Lrp family transcriptional regulator
MKEPFANTDAASKFKIFPEFVILLRFELCHRKVIFRGGPYIMAKKFKLDTVDKRILSDLQEHGRMTNVELAKNAGISAPPCLRRVRALEDAEIIKGYHADIDGEALGYTVTIFAFVGLTSQAETDLQEFEVLVNSWDMVRECHMLMGETDFLLKIVARDWDDFQRFLTSNLTPAPNVSHVKTALAIRSRKNMPGVPINFAP